MSKPPHFLQLRCCDILAAQIPTKTVENINAPPAGVMAGQSGSPVGLEILYEPKEAVTATYELSLPRPMSVLRSHLLTTLLPELSLSTASMDIESKLGPHQQPMARIFFWPRDALPRDRPTCRVVTFGYDVGPVSANRLDQSIFRIVGDELLTTISRLGENMKLGLLIFIAHNLGGLVVKEASSRFTRCTTAGRLTGTRLLSEVLLLSGSISMRTQPPFCFSVSS